MQAREELVRLLDNALKGAAVLRLEETGKHIRAAIEAAVKGK